eukprot:Awhi_evm1s11662
MSVLSIVFVTFLLSVANGSAIEPSARSLPVFPDRQDHKIEQYIEPSTIIDSCNWLTELNSEPYADLHQRCGCNIDCKKDLQCEGNIHYAQCLPEPEVVYPESLPGIQEGNTGTKPDNSANSMPVSMALSGIILAKYLF